MKFRQKALFIFVFLAAAISVSAQKTRTSPNPKTSATAETKVSEGNVNAVRASAAFAELTAQKALVEAELKILLTDYKEDYIEVRERRAEYALLTAALRNLEKTPSAEISKLTLALGKLVVKKISIEAELKTLLEDYTEDFPAVKKARTRLGVYEEEIRRLLSGKPSAE